MTIRPSPYGYWSSDRMFVLVAAGAVISLGNVWRLPFLMGTYGGSAFLLVYVLCCALVVLPVLVGELLMGRWTRANLIAASRLMVDEAEANRLWLAIGVLSLIGAVLVLSFYSVIAGWSMAYVFRATGGGLQVVDLTEAEEIFLGLAGDSERSLAWHTLFIIATTICAAHGRDGIEKISRWLVPTAFLLMLGILVFAMQNANLGQAAAFLFDPDWSALGWRGVLEALGQAFFSLSLGVGVMIAYGVYLEDQRSVMRIGVAVIGLDLAFAIISGLGVYALVFAATQVPTSSASLVFEMLPLAVSDTDGGRAILIMLYLALLIVTLTSGIALMEPVIVWVKERFEVSRVFATTSSALVIWFLGLGTLLSFSAFSDVKVLDRTFYDWVALITSQVLVPTVGLLVCVFVSRSVPESLLVKAWGGERDWSYRAWMWCLRYPARIGLILVVLYTVGVFDWMVDLWQTPPASGVADVVTVIEAKNGGR